MTAEETSRYRLAAGRLASVKLRAVATPSRVANPTEADIEGIHTRAFEQFRVDLSYPRPKADQRWLALIVLLNKGALPKSLIWKLYADPRFKADPRPLVALAQVVNLAKMSGVVAGLLRDGELSPLLLRRWLNPASLVTM